MSDVERQRLAAARLWAANRYPYLAHALFACSISIVEDLGGIVVDEHWRLYVDPFIVAEWPIELIGTTLVHHVGHLLRDHAERGRAQGIDDQTQKDWTLACDAEINDDLKAVDLPGRPVTPESLGLEPGRFAEEYFHALHHDDHKSAPDEGDEPGAQDCGSGADGRPRSYEEPGGIGPQGAHLLRCQVASEIMRQGGKEPGSIPMGLMRWAEELLQPRVDWRRMLAAEIREGVSNVSGMVDYSYSRPARRQSISPEVVLPSLRKPIPYVAVVCDTSGSMGEREIGRVLAEVEGILRHVGLGSGGVRVLSCDAAVNAVKKVTSVRQVELYGGGGTNMGEGLRVALQARPRPQVVIVLTDGYTPWPDDGPKGARVVVGLIGDGAPQPPRWARVVRIDEEVA